MIPAPKRRWSQYGKPWGLLAKTNRTATPASVARHAVGSSIVGTILYGAVIYFRNEPTDSWPAKLILWAIGFAFVGGLMEWQTDDSDDESSE